MTTQPARRHIRLVLPLLGLLTAPVLAGTPAAHSHLLTALDEVESHQANLCVARTTQGTLAGTVGGLADQVRVAIPAGSENPRAVEAVNRLIFSQLGIRGSPDLKDPCNLLPSRVLERKQGYCVGIAALFLLVAERLDLPVFAVATPSHVFLRYDDGATRINIETLQQGANISDEQYIREQKIPEESIRRGVFLRNLTTDEFLAQVHNNLGVIYSERRDFQEAAREYEAALHLDPRLPATFYNWGNDLLRRGMHRKAIRRFSKSLRLYSTDVWALNNRGLAYLKMGKREKARRDFEAALRIDPGFEQARKNVQSLR